jgi:hypothetical protein
MDLVLFEQNKPLVLRALGDGDFDYIEAASEVFETEFFRFIKGKKILDQLSQSYPSPRKKEEVPLWVYVASNLSMRLHGVHSFNSYPLMVRAGGMLNAFGPRAGRKVSHPDSGDITIVCEGFNRKNHFDRETPCDQDFLRKVAKDTDAEALMKWFCDDVQRVFRNHGVFDEEGIFIGDGSYLFVPDNPNYEGSVRLLFDEHHHPISLEQYKELSDERKLRCQWRRCYKMVTLLHTNRALEFFIFVAVRVVPGNEHECSILYELVREFAQGAGSGVMKRLIVDRGFIDGEEISRCKKDYGIDILIPVRRNMDIYGDAMALFQLPEVEWVHCKEAPAEMRKLARPRPKAIVKREKKRQEKLKQIKEAKPSLPLEKTLVKTETAAIGQFTSWQPCTVPLSVVANREHYADGHEKIWLLIDTKEVHNPCQAREDYHLRTATEERYRQLKCFADLTSFTSRAFSMVANQVVFSMLSYNLLQLYLLRQARKDLNKKIPPRIRQQLLPSDNHIIVYWKNYYALFTPLEFAGTIATLGEQARKKIAEKSRRLRRELNGAMTNPRAP